MDQSGSNGNIKEAVRRVLHCLPDKGLVPVTVYRTIVRDLALGTSDRLEVRALVKACPRYFGVERKPAYWRIVQEHLEPQEAVAAYLVRFRDQVTTQQVNSIRRYLIRLGFDPVMVETEIRSRGFVTMPHTGCRDPQKCSGPWFFE